MRQVVRSRTYLVQLESLVEQGARDFGTRVANEKLVRVDRTIESFLARHPNTKRPHLKLGLRVYPVTKTPFVVLYDFDDIELRIHFIFYASASLRGLDPNSARW